MKLVKSVLAAVALAISCQAWSADAPAGPTCNSGPESGWKSPDVLKKKLSAQSIMVTEVKLAGDCDAVYALNKANQPVNNYYHPVSLKLVGPIKN